MSDAILKIREKRKNEDGECLIYIQYCHRQKPTLISTGEKIEPKHWDAENGKIKSSLKGYAGKNDLIGHKRDSVNDIVRRLKIADKEPTGQLVKEEYEKRQNKGDEPKDLLQYYQVYLDEITPKFAGGTMAGKYTNLAHLTKFAADNKLKLTFDSINKDFYDKFNNYLIGLELANNTRGKQIKNIKAFLNYFTEKGLNSNLAFKKFTKPTNDTIIITFEEKELKAIHKLKKLTPSLQKAKDLLLLECYTGLRYSDIQNLKPENIDFENQRIKITTQKTKETYSIPLLKQAMEILKKYTNSKDGLPKLSNQKFNDAIKDIGELAKINTPTQIVGHIGGERHEETFPKYQLISSHIGRRTFITQSLQKGMRPEMIMKITGHKDYESFKKYIKLTESRAKEELFKAWGN